MSRHHQVADTSSSTSSLHHDVQVLAAQISDLTSGVSRSDVETVLSALFKKDFLDSSCIATLEGSVVQDQREKEQRPQQQPIIASSGNFASPNTTTTTAGRNNNKKKYGSLLSSSPEEEEDDSPLPALISNKAQEEYPSSSFSSLTPIATVPNRQSEGRSNSVVLRQKRNRHVFAKGLCASSSDSEAEDKDDDESDNLSDSGSSCSSSSAGNSSANHRTSKNSSSSRSSTTIIKSTRIPTTDSGKRLFHRELCEFLAKLEEPATVDEMEEQFGWTPAIQSGKSFKTQPSLQDYVTCFGGLIYALPTVQDWENLDQSMQKSKKLQVLKDFVPVAGSSQGERDDNNGGEEGEKEQQIVKEYQYMDADDYFSAVDEMYNRPEEGFFKPPRHVDIDLRNQYLSHWITNRNGRYFLNEKPAPRQRDRHRKLGTDEVTVAEEKKKPQRRVLVDKKTSSTKTSSKNLSQQQQKIRKPQPRLLDARRPEIESETEADSDDEVDSVPSSSNKTSSTVNTLSSTNTVPLIPTIPDEEFEKVDATKEKDAVPRAPPVPQFGGKSGNPALFYKYHQRSETGSIVAKGGQSDNNTEKKKKVSFDPALKVAASSTIGPKRKSKGDDGEEEIPAWVTAPIRFADC